MSTQQSREPIYLRDYQPPAFLIETTWLDVQLEPTRTQITGKLALQRNPASNDKNAPLVLDGEGLELLEVRLDGEVLSASDYEVEDSKLTITQPIGDMATVETVSLCDPEANKALNGLYRSQGIYCTQCEPEGFRRITWFIDRPDVLATYHVRLEADKRQAPVLLANGNLIDNGDLEGGRHFAAWHDPFPKPSYLFAMVGGELFMVEDSFTTMSGRDVVLRIFVEPGKEDRCDWAMDSLKRSMKWDEERFGREYDLDLFMIVAVSDFNMGAMENKGLNIFNDKLILARPDTATDADYANIERVIAHEYFHNWTGNRITCRDWFQLCLKEGLTVYRDQEFSSDERDRTVQRIKDVRDLQSYQFPEDSGPLSHPVRPDHFIEINNFYTSTVYDKGSEVVRMIATMLGRDGFRQGLDLYFERHDGEAATVEQFVKCFEDATGKDLTQFMRWYEQAGTPELACSLDYDKHKGEAELKITQLLPPTPGQERKQAQHIPLKMGLIGADGRELALDIDQPEALNEGVLDICKREQSFRFRNITERPVPSLLRGFSAPVKLNVAQNDEDLLFLMRHDPDLFNRWQAAQTYYRRLLISNVAALKQQAPLDDGNLLAEALAHSIEDSSLAPAFRAQLLIFPGENDIAREIGKDVDPEAIHQARKSLRTNVGEKLIEVLQRLYDSQRPEGAYSPDAASAGKRGLRHAALGLMVATGKDEMYELLKQHYFNADNMTEEATALDHLTNTNAPARDEALQHFFDKWQDDHVVIDKWFAFQAFSPQPDTLERIRELMKNPLFSLRNPNKVRALVAAFAMGNPRQFNRPDGKGYEFLEEMILEIDSFNPQMASRLTGAYKSWKILETGRRTKLKNILDNLSSKTDLSRDTYEIVSKVNQ